jgi:hypothetical protein
VERSRKPSEPTGSPENVDRTWTYTVETDTMVYGFSAIGKGWHQRPRNLSVGKEVKFAFGENEDVWLLDEDGKEFKASVTKKAVKPAPKS